MKKIGIIHTTSATVSGLKQLVMDNIEDAVVINLLDDSILPDIINQNKVDFVEARWCGYAATLEEMGVDVILSACSTVGEIADRCNEQMKIPVLRIDEAMAEKAIAGGDSISILATLASTLEPTAHLIEKKASQQGKKVALHSTLVEGAYQSLLEGQQELHDQKIRAAIELALEQADVIVLAQASMASAWNEERETDRILTSPVLGIQRLKQVLSRQMGVSA